jgi:hypothetical protein
VTPGETDREETAASSGAASADVVENAVGVVESLADYLLALVRLEGFRLEREGRAMAVRLGLLVAAGAVALLGLFLLALAGALGLGEWLGSPAAGFALIGALLVAVAGILWFLSRRRARPVHTDESS